MILLRQSTASQEVLIGPFLSDTDGKTAQTGLSIANTDIKVWKSGATSEASKNSGGATHIASGRYYGVFDATDTDTVGSGEINVHVSGALPVKVKFQVLEEAVYDQLFAASAAGYQVPIWSSAGATVNLSATTISTSQAVASVSGAVASVTGNVGGNVVGSVASVTAGVTVTTNNDKTGYSLSQSFPSNFSSLAITAAGKVTVGTNDDKTGYSLSQAFPTNFSSLAITGGGAVTAGTVSDKTGYSLTQSFPSNFSAMAITAAGLVSINTAQTLSAARLLDSVADTDLTINDALHCAAAGAAGKEDVTGTAYTIKTPFTGTTLRVFVLDSSTAPTSRT